MLGWRWGCVLLWAWFGGMSLVQALEAPSGPVLLKVTGDIKITNVDDEAHFDRAMLEALPQHETRTHLPWYDGRSVYRGPLLRDLLSAVGSTGSLLRVSALNDYVSEIPVSDAMEHDVILAMSRDGVPMRVRDQGPLFVIYPFDDFPELYTEVYLHRSVWQVSSIDVRRSSRP